MTTQPTAEKFDPAAQVVAHLVARALLSPEVGPDVFRTVPPDVISSLPDPLRDAFNSVREDVIENGSADGKRILARANGECPSLSCLFTDLIAADVPPLPAVIEALRKIRHAPRVTILENLKPRSLRDLLSDPSLTEPEPVLDGILGVGELAVLGGPPKAMKSWTVKSIALSLAAAQPWLGFEVHRPFRTLYLSAEGRECRLKERFEKMIAFSPDAEDETFDRLEVLSTGGKLKFDTDAGEDAFLRIAEPFDVIIADPFYRFIANGDENSHADQRRIQDLFDRVKGDGKAVILVHHLRKAQGVDAGISEIRGAGLDGYADAIFILQRKREQSDDRFSLRFTTRNYEDPPDMELKRDGVLLVPIDDSERKVSRLDVMTALTLAGGEMTGKDLTRALRETTQAGDRTIERAIADAKNRKAIDSKPSPGRGQGKIYFIRAEEA